MISRRLVRVKAMQTYYSYLQNNEDVSAEKAWNNLEQSLNKSYELYISLHCLLLQICKFAENKIEVKKNKFLATEAELNPNLRFVNNQVFKFLRKNPTIFRYFENLTYNWSDCNELIKSIYNQIEKSSFYKKYMSADECTIKDDIKIIRDIIINCIDNNSDVDNYLEEKNIFWNDDLELLLSTIIQNTSKIKEKDDFAYQLSPMFKCPEDEDFARELIIKCIKNRHRYDEYLNNSLKDWELERIALLDKIIIHLILCEILEMSDLPLQIILNEWIEISKYYSTNRSNKFINGVIDEICIKLKNERKTF